MYPPNILAIKGSEKLVPKPILIPLTKLSSPEEGSCPDTIKYE
jgi:hypothetical protein